MIRRALRPTASLRHRVALSYRSKARETLYRSRRPLVASILSARPDCEIKAPGCTLRSTECHEVLTRARGGSITEELNILAACHTCHRYITEHPAEAAARGWTRHAWEAS